MTELGEIPNNWEVKKLDEISNITRLAGAEYSDIWETDDNGTIIALKGNNIGKNNLILNDIERITEEMSNRLIRSKLFKNDIVFPCVGTIGKATVINEDNKYHINQNIAKITPSSGINSLYLSYYLMSDFTVKEIFKYNTSSSQPNVLVGNLRKFNIIVPSTEEQEKIASILSIVDEQIDNVDALIEKNKELKKGLMQTLLTKGIGHAKFKKTEIGEIPDEWELKELIDIKNCNKNNSFVDGDWIESEFITDEGIRIIQTGNIGIGKYIDKVEKKYISNSSFKELNCKEVEAGDILICRMAEPTGRACIAPDIEEKMVTAVDCTIVKVDEEKYCKEFVIYYLNSDSNLNRVIKFEQGSTRRRISRINLEKLSIIRPGIREQKKIAAILLEFDKKIEEYENKKQKLGELKRGLMQQLLTGKIRVI